MTLGAWVLVGAVLVAVVLGLVWSMTNGVFRGTRRLRGRAGRVSTRARPGARPARPPEQARPARPPEQVSVLAGTTYDAERGERATLLQFSSAFCAPCRATRRVLGDVAAAVPGVVHVEVDAEHHLDLVRELGVMRTPTTLVLDSRGREITRATGAPRPAQVLAALESGLS